MQTPTRPAHAGYPDHHLAGPKLAQSTDSQPAPSGASTLEACGAQAAHARLAAQALLTELEHADRLIPLLLRDLSPAGKARITKHSDQAGDIAGATRHHERATALAMARVSTLAVQTPAPTTSTAALQAARLLMVLCMVVALCNVTGCSGGSDEPEPEPDKTIDPLVCMHRPELCR